MPLGSFIAILLALWVSGAAWAETVTLEALGLRVEPLQDGFVRVTAVQQPGPFWRADITAGDVLRNDIRSLSRENDRALRSIEGGIRLRALRIFHVRTPNFNDLNRSTFDSLDIQLVAFEGAQWHEDGVRASERAADANGVMEQQEALGALIDEAIAQIAEFPCTAEGKLSEASEQEIAIWADEADGQAVAVGLDPLPGQSVRDAAIRRNVSCRRELFENQTQARVLAFDASVGVPAAGVVEFAEFGLRVRPLEVTNARGRQIATMQIHEVEEEGPFWRALNIRPGDLIVLPENALRHTLERTKRRWEDLRPGTARLLTLPMAYLSDAFPVGNAPQVNIPMVDHQPTGVWHGDRLSAQERARQSAGPEEFERFQQALDGHLERLVGMGCSGTQRLRDQMVAELDVLYILAGRYPPGAPYEFALNRASSTSCDNERLGPVAAEDFDRLALMRSAAFLECGDAEAVDESMRELQRDVTRNNYARVAEFTIRELFERQDASAVSCVVTSFIEDLQVQ